MKRFIIIAAVCCLASSGANAQGFFQRLGDRAKNAAENAIGRKVENTIDSTVDNIGKVPEKGSEQEAAPAQKQEAQSGWTCPECGKKGNTGKFCSDCGAKAPQASEGWTCPECGKKGNTGKFCSDCGAKAPSASSEWTCPECGKKGNTGKFCADCGAKAPGVGGAAAQPKKKAATVEYVKSDFVPGDEIFFEDMFDGEQVGEFPSRWDLRGGQQCEVAVVNGKKAFRLGESAEVAPLMKQEDYLPEAFTLEYDVWVIESEASGANCYLGPFFRGANDEWVADTHFPPMYPNSWGWSGTCCTSTGNQVNFSESQENMNNCLRPNDWNHIAVSFNKRAMKIYVNGTRVASIPNMKQPTKFRICTWCPMDDANRSYFFTNVRLAKGAVPLYDRLVSDGKIITYAITFETGKADLKPESMVEISRMAELMKQNPNLSFEVQGHCDATGSDAVNDPLSQKRAEAIVAAMVEQGIASARLKAVGKGSHSPIASNSNEEGRAKNRRVEFVKK